MPKFFVKDPLKSLPGFYRKRWEVKSFNGSEQTYIVGLATDGKWECNCPHAKFRKKECKHILFVQNTLAKVRELEK